MGKIVITIMAFSAVASMSSVASAQTIVLDRMDIKVAQLGGVESYRPSGQLFIGKTLSQVRVAITFGTFDANGSFAAYPDATCGSILINPPAPAGGLKWIILDPITIKPNRAGLRVCQAELQYKLGGNRLGPLR